MHMTDGPQGDHYRFHHIHINTTDYNAALDFYLRIMDGVLDHTGEWNGRHTAAIDLGGVRILVSDRVYPQTDEPGHSPGVPFYGVEHISLSTPHLDETVTRLKSRGAKFFEDLHTMRGNMRIAIVRGPDNVRIELLGSG